MGLVRTTDAAAEPIELDGLKDHSRITSGTAEDDLLEALVTSARQYAEDQLERALITQTWKWTLDAFPCGALKVPRPPLQSVTSIKYVDTDGVQQTLDSSAYRIDTTSEPATIEPAYGETWPDTQDVSAAVEIIFVAGYGTTAATVPAPIKQGLLLLLGSWYENRESVITGTIVTELPMAVKSLWSPYRVWGF